MPINLGKRNSCFNLEIIRYILNWSFYHYVSCIPLNLYLNIRMWEETLTKHTQPIYVNVSLVSKPDDFCHWYLIVVQLWLSDNVLWFEVVLNTPCEFTSMQSLFFVPAYFKHHVIGTLYVVRLGMCVFQASCAWYTMHIATLFAHFSLVHSLHAIWEVSFLQLYLFMNRQMLDWIWIFNHYCNMSHWDMYNIIILSILFVGLWLKYICFQHFYVCLNV